VAQFSSPVLRGVSFDFSPLFEVALVLVRADHSASVIVNADHSVM